MIKPDRTIHPASCKCRRCTAPQMPHGIERDPRCSIHGFAVATALGVLLWAIFGVIAAIIWWAVS